MSQINALEVTHRLKDRMVEFSLDDNYVRDDQLRSALESLISAPAQAGGLASDVWVEGSFPSRSAEQTLKDIVDAGGFDPELASVLDHSGAFPLDRHPYKHQQESLAAARSGYAADTKPAVVVSAGTGAGKTESFLLPLLDDIYRHAPQDGEGVSAIILYPMNALVNDQVDRLQEWLSEQDRASFIHFTSETPETVRLANRQGLVDLGPCRFRSREHARGVENRKGHRLEERGSVPRILVTNYSMLEYMLCRPQDFVFFGKNLRSIVLDEAHLYTGNLAAEISLLLRRVYEKCGCSSRDVVHYATSATIGGADDPNRVLGGFASQLFGKPQSDVKVILGERIDSPIPEEMREAKPEPETAGEIASPPWPENFQTITVDDEGNAELATADEDSWSALRSLLTPLFPGKSEWLEEVFSRHEGEKAPARLLHDVLCQSPAFAATVEALRKSERMPISELVATIFGREDAATTEAVRRVLSLGAMARDTSGAYPHLPNRIHYLIRGMDGVLLSFNMEAAPSDDVKVGNLGYLLSPSSQTARQIQDPSVALTLARCGNSGEWFVAAFERNGILSALRPSIVMGFEQDRDILDGIRYFSITPSPEGKEYGFDPPSGKIGAPEAGKVSLWQLNDCPSTGNPIADSVSFFARRSRLQLSLLAEAALMEMPPYPDVSKAWKPAEGRRLLIFSDSRTEAARLGPRFTRQHELQLVRSSVADSLASGGGGDPRVIEMLKGRITEATEQIAGLPEGDPVREMLEEEKEKYETNLLRSTEGESMEKWSRRFSQNERMFQILNLEFGRKHTVDDPDNKWSQQAWETNRAEVIKITENENRPIDYLSAEFARRSLWPSVTLETNGLAEVVYYGISDWKPSPAFRAQIPQTVEEKLTSVWPDLIAALLDEARTNGAVTLGSRELDQSYEYAGASVGRYLTIADRYKSVVIPLQSSTRRSKIHRFVVEVLRRAGLENDQLDDKASELLEAVFVQLFDNAHSLDWLETDTRQVNNGTASAIRLIFKHLGLRQPQKLFRCVHTGQVWPRSVLQAYVGCPSGELLETTTAELDADPRVGRSRRELKDSPLFRFGLWAEEHSAQLNPKENKRIQNLFKQGVRNILSSTTTLELGIDIGGLNGVLMGNIPPGKANYLQRAGRAGRRADGSSLVLGYARPTPYEREVFLDFGKYLREDLREPTIFLNRSEILRRHVHAHLLGHFFGMIRQPEEATGAMDSFGRMGAFCGEPRLPYWERSQSAPDIPAPDDLLDFPEFAGDGAALADHFLAFLDSVKDDPDTYRPALERLVEANIQVTKQVRGNWEGVIDEIHEEFSAAITEWRREYQQLVQRWKEIVDGGDERIARAAAASIYFQANTYFHLTVIESLGDRLVIPRYGFPIGLSRLRVAVPDEKKPSVVREEDQFRLQRSSMMAIREYVPGSKLIVGGRLITSRGILKHWTGSDIQSPDASLGLRGWFVRAPDAGRFEYSHSGKPDVDFDPNGNLDEGEMIFAKHGFTSAAWDPPKISQAYEVVGRVESYSSAFTSKPDEQEILSNYAGIDHLEGRYRAAGELVLMNPGSNDYGFAVCTKCGFAESEKKPTGQGRVDLTKGFEWHTSLFTADDTTTCWGMDDTHVLRHQHLAARQVTHLALFDLGHWLSIGNRQHHLIANAIAQCLRLAGCRLRQLDTREIGILDVTASPTKPGGCAIILYDSVAGGSGHVYEMFSSLTRVWWERAARYLDIPDGEDPPRERAMMRRIVTADSPTKKGVPQYDPLSAERLFEAMLRNETWTPPQPHDPSTGNGDDEEEAAPPAPNLADILAKARSRTNNED